MTGSQFLGGGRYTIEFGTEVTIFRSVGLGEGITPAERIFKVLTMSHQISGPSWKRGSKGK